MPAIRVTGLTKRFGSRTVLSDVTFTLPEGGLGLISGRSGSGKSTLMAVLSGLEPPSAGEVVVGGRDLARMSDADRTAYRLRDLGIIFQDYRLIPDLTVEENVRLPMGLAGTKRAASVERARRLLDLVGLADRRGAWPEVLSGGEQQRVSVARALANDPAVVLADEPTANLDEENAHRVLSLLREIARRGKTVLVVSHDPLAVGYATQRWRIADGRVVPQDAAAVAR